MSSQNGSVTADTSYYESEKSETENLTPNIKNKYQIDTIKHRYPFCIVWTPIPLISWLIPSIGHVGICESNGIIHDFAGPFYVSIDDMAFGFPTKAIVLKLSEKEFNEYDKAVNAGTNHYNKMDYNFFTNNCHSFVAKVLNKLKYKGKNDYTMVDVWWMLVTRSRFLSWIDMFKSYCGFMVIMFIIFIIYNLIK